MPSILRRVLPLLAICSFNYVAVQAQTPPRLDKTVAVRLAEMPLHCIGQEFSNKTSHSADSASDARLLPSELHPAFYLCFD